MARRGACWVRSYNQLSICLIERAYAKPTERLYGACHPAAGSEGSDLPHPQADTEPNRALQRAVAELLASDEGEQ